MASFNIDGQDALNQIKSLIAEVNNLKTAIKNISTSNVDSFDKLEQNYANLKVKVGELTNKLKYLEAILIKNSKAELDNASATNKAAVSSDKHAKSKDKEAKAIDRATKETKENTKASLSLSGTFKTLFSSISGVLGAFGIIAGVRLFGQILKDVFETTKTFDSLNFALERISGSMFAAADSQRFLLDITRSYGVELVTTTNRWIKFLAAAKQSGLSLRDTENIFRSMTKAAGVLGLKTDELTGIYLALEQMLSKGKVTTEELRRQLGERLPGAMGIMAAAIGVTIPKLDEMLKKGQVLSADVLPKFAEAVELAYDIKNVETIETLVASQNSLTAAWQLFIKNVSEGDSVVRAFFGGFLDGLTLIINQVNDAISTPAQKLEEQVLKETKILEQLLDSRSSKILSKQKGSIDEEKRLNEEAFKAKTAIARAVSAEERKEAEENYNTLINELILFNKEKDALTKKFAADNIEFARDQYDENINLQKEFNSNLQRLQNIKDNDPFKFARNKDLSVQVAFEGFEFLGKAITNVDELNKAQELLNSNVAESTARWALFKKLIEESNVVVPDDESTEKSQRNLRLIQDLTLEIQNSILKQHIAHNEEVLSSDRSSIQERLNAQEELYKNEVALAKNNQQIKFRDLDDSHKAELESLKESLNEGRLSKERYDKFVEESEKELEQKRELIFNELVSQLNEINTKQVTISIDIASDQNDISIDNVEDLFNQRIIALQNEFKAAETTADRRKEIEKELKNVIFEMGNAIIQKKIEIAKASIIGLDAESDYVKKVKRDINDLEASLKSLPPDNEDDWHKYWNGILDLVSEFSNSVGDFINSIFESRIENINAEIEAEREKYDLLIELAEGEELQQKVLRRNKEKDIKALEKKRLKEEQKQAKFRKAQAIADIAISTAQAIMSIWAQVPKFDFGISAGLLTAFVSALGAIQIGAVLAAPIPKYKEGTKGKVGKEHLGMINDGLVQEYVERKGKILTTERKNAIVKLQPGDVVYKNYKEMSEKSSVINAMTNSNRITKERYNDSFINIEDSIKNGFKNAKVNNNIKLVGFDRNYQSYKDSVLNWSKK